MINWYLFFSVMVVTSIADAICAMYFIAIEERKAIKAAFWSSLIILCAAFNIVSYSENRWYIIAAVIGAFIGTYFTVRFKKKK